MALFQPFEEHKNPSLLSIIRKAIASSTTTIILLLNITVLAIKYGDLATRSVNGAYTNIPEALAMIEYGTILLYVIAIFILIGPLDYYAYQSDIGSLDLIISLLLIYFLCAILVGITMRHYNAFGGFILGFVTIAYMNLFLYLFLSGLQSVFQNQIDVISMLGGILKGIYGRSFIDLLIYSTLINGLIFGVFGSFWAAIFQPRKEKLFVPSLKCDKKMFSDNKICKIDF